MKKHLRFIVVIAALLALVGCQKQEADNDVADIWNGYESYKYSTMTVDIKIKTRSWGGWKCHGSRYKQKVIGTAEYIFTDDAHFEVIFRLTDGYELVKTYMYAGDYDAMPTGRWNYPRFWNFPNITTHEDNLTEYTYSIPVVDLPPGQTGFVIAATAKVEKNNKIRRAWAEGDRRFSGKGWGMYTSNYFQEAMDIIVLYGVEQTTSGELRIQHINASSGNSELILEETVATNGSVEGIAYDPSSSLLYFAIGNDLYVNDLNSDTVSELVGNISGVASGATHMNGNYYYYNSDQNSANFAEILEVAISFDTIAGWSAVENGDYSYPITDDISHSLEVTDMASNNGIIYLIGTDNNSTPNQASDDIFWLVSWENSSYNFINADVSSDAQIAFGADDQLYAIQQNSDGDSFIQTMDTDNGNTNPDIPSDGDFITGDGSGSLNEITGGIVK